MNIDFMISKLREGDRRQLAKAITLIESTKSEHQPFAEELMNKILPYTGNSIRIGITGVPGAGKSTFIESFGKYLTSNNHRVAVLAVDPSSQISGGSILGDKTRMEELSRDENAFIRPSPSGESLGGVARKTRETMLLCESAGYDVIIIETVGVGQSETTVASMVDIFALIQIPNAGDELQGIKKGVMEIADIILINKADGDNVNKANLAKSQLINAIHILRQKSKDWEIPVMTCSALKNENIDTFWDYVQKYKNIMLQNGEFEGKRKRQALDWMWSLVMEELKNIFMNNDKIKVKIPQIQELVLSNKVSPTVAANRLLNEFKR
jgi:LAO/AO transport system kinase